MATQDLLFGYVGWIQSRAQQASVAALLVTNHRGIPVEFRYTEPVELSEMQRLLHPQASLNATLATTLARSLWSATERKPRLLLVEDADFAEFWHELPASEQGMFLCVEVAPDDSYQMPERKGSVVLPVETGSGRLLRMQALPERDEVVELARRVFAEASEQMRLDEPFERVETILRALHKLPASDVRRRSATASTRESETRATPDVPKQTPQPATRLVSRSERLMQRGRAFEADPGVASNRASRPTETPSVPERRPAPALMRRATMAADEVSLEPELTGEAIQERLRRYGVRNENHALRVERLRATSTAPREDRLAIDGDVRAEARSVPRRLRRDDDTDLEIAAPAGHRSETEVQRWKERFGSFRRPQNEEPEIVVPDYSRIQREPRAVEEEPENISHLTRMDSLRARPDLNWLKNRERRS